MKNSPKLEAFADFLRSLEKSESTIASYLSYVRRVLREIDPLTSQTLYEADAGDFFGSGRHIFRTAWRAFAAFGKTRGIAVPLPDFDDRREKRGSAESPVGAAIEWLSARGFDYRRIAQCTWRSVSRGVETAQIEGITVPPALLEDLIKWAYPDPINCVVRKTTALIPAVSGGRRSMMPMQLRVAGQSVSEASILAAYARYKLPERYDADAIQSKISSAPLAEKASAATGSTPDVAL